MKEALEAFKEWTMKHKADWPLGAMIVNGKFSHFLDSDTDTAWIGFYAGWMLARTDQ